MIKYNKNQEQDIINAFLDGKILIMLTDTVYGIMGLATKENELKINKLKQSDINKKLSIIFPDKPTLYKYLTKLDVDKKELIETKLPGKYTFIVNLDNFSNFNRNDFGVRITSNSYLQNILSSVGPILATSCNISGSRVCTSIEEIEEIFKNEDVILVEDINSSNTASTIIDIREDIKIIRN